MLMSNLIYIHFVFKDQAKQSTVQKIFFFFLYQKNHWNHLAEAIPTNTHEKYVFVQK